jgi:hypothetical protein
VGATAGGRPLLTEGTAFGSWRLAVKPEDDQDERSGADVLASGRFARCHRKRRIVPKCFDVLNRYGEAADRRDWPLYDQVFTSDATADYGMSKLTGRQAIVNLIRKSLGGCGPTQHLLGNHTRRD